MPSPPSPRPPFKKRKTWSKRTLAGFQKASDELANTTTEGKFIQLPKIYAAKIRGVAARHYRKHTWDGKIFRSTDVKSNLEDPIDQSYLHQEKETLEETIETFLHDILTPIEKEKLSFGMEQNYVSNEETSEEEGEEESKDLESSEAEKEIKSDSDEHELIDEDEFENRVDLTKNQCLCIIDRLFYNMSNEYQQSNLEYNETSETLFDPNDESESENENENETKSKKMDSKSDNNSNATDYSNSNSNNNAKDLDDALDWKFMLTHLALAKFPRV
ncbi:MAG: hypothetical protein EXX96DRAFT_336653 [Benjaminiella poitrasii]|nr:MAG: hypothetical protein EXX96DRAFT_336653 [Benjaminiella poitrasii]